eukprot:m.171741 g.171741  ORF g.171741 m.171741 type:complete len:188 (+) comp31660_c0_seq2:223-786(+)
MDTLKKGLKDFKKGAKVNYAKLTGDEEAVERLEAEDESLLGGIKDEVNQACGLCKLTRKQRLYGFFWSLVLGFVMSGLGILLLGLHNILGFAITYSVGTIISISSSMFLFGPWYQIKRMFKETRIFAVLIMLVAIGMTLYVALALRSVPLAILCVAIQFIAVIWYGLSFIPYARKIVTSCLKGALGF